MLVAQLLPLALLHAAPRRSALSAVRRASVTLSMCAGGPPVGVVGGGVAGVAAARRLAEAGVPVVLHEREPQLGGRLGALNLGGDWVGTGCSYIKAKDAAFVRQLEAWEEQGVLVRWAAHPHTVTAPGEWTPLPVPDDERWYAGQPHMGSPLELSASERETIRVVRGDVYDANFNGPLWVLAAANAAVDEEEGECFDADALESHIHSALVVATPGGHRA